MIHRHLTAPLLAALEARGGRLVGVEVKASATVSGNDFNALRVFAEATKKRFHRGVVLYTGSESLRFGPGLHALPVTAVWRLGSEKLSALASREDR